MDKCRKLAAIGINSFSVETSDSESVLPHSALCARNTCRTSHGALSECDHRLLFVVSPHEGWEK
jgi:hypothetical protein